MDEEIEEWKDVVGYEGLYKVSNFGNVYSCYVNRNLSQGNHKDGYKFVILRKNGNDKYKTVHRLVAEAFIPNPNNLPLINHRDENPSNNYIDNLEWCDYLYNNTYNNVHLKRAEYFSKKVYAYNKDGDLAYEYNSTHDAERDLNIGSNNISYCCLGNTLTYKGFVWSYNKLSKQDVLDRFEKTNRKGKPKSISVNQFDLNGNFINSYKSVREAGRELKINRYAIASVCRRESEQTHGFIFEYADNNG